MLRSTLRRYLGRYLAALLLAALAAGPAAAREAAQEAAQAQAAQQQAVAFAANGRAQGEPLTIEALRALPATSLDISFLTSRGEERARYTGAPLWDILVRRGLVDTARHHGELCQVAGVTGRDGYFVVLSLGDIAPELGDRRVLLAYERDGAPLPPEKGIRLIVPGDRRGARSVVDVVRIDVRTLEPDGKETPP